MLNQGRTDERGKSWLRPKMIVTLVVVVLALVLSAHAQGFTGAVTGTVTDTTGAVLPGAKVRLINTSTDERRRFRAE